MSTYGCWVCGSCAARIPNGVTHSCPSIPVRTQPSAPSLTSVDHSFAYTQALQRIAAALEKIAEALADGRAS